MSERRVARSGDFQAAVKRASILRDAVLSPVVRLGFAPKEALRPAVKICDLTQFYSPVSGGVKRYVSEKVRHIRERTAGDEHVLIIPGERDEVIQGERSRVYTIKSPLISRTSRYRVLLRLEAVGAVLERERPT